MYQYTGREIAMLDFNRANLLETPLTIELNELIERSEPPGKNTRQYLGASALGSECLRKIQFDWMCDPVHPVRMLSIFARGHFFEDVARQHLIRIGFKFAPAEKLEFQAAEGLFRGHADAILLDGPRLPGLEYPAIWEHKCLNAKGWRAIERDGLVGLYASYATQVSIYQAYLDITNPALFSVTNADTCERLHLLVPFDSALAQRMSDRAVALIEATRAGELLDRITDNSEDWRCKMCGHRTRCWRLP
jgi:hypothetical protein